MYSRTPSPLTPEAQRLGTREYIRAFDTDTRVDDTAEFLECYSLERGHTNAKITVLSAGRHGGAPDCYEECELDGSYSEFVETQWAKGSVSEVEPISDSIHGSEREVSHDIGSDTESVVVSAPLHGPTTVRCVCVCNKKGCEYVNKPYDLHSIRESPAGKMSRRYRLVTWLRSFIPPTAQSPTIDTVDVGSRVYPEKKSKIVRLFRSRRFRKSGVRAPEGEVAPNTVEGLGKSLTSLNVVKKPVFPGEMKRLRACDVSIPRSIGVMIGVTLILLGVTYDHGVKHGVDNLLQECWSWLRTSYMNFGDEFVSYNSLFFRITNSEVLGEPYPRYGLNGTKKESSNITKFQEAINKVDPKFLFILEGLRLSVQLFFFSINDKAELSSKEVVVHEKGPLFFRISFKRTAGLQVDYVPERSSMTLSTPFHVYDLMKMIITSNGLPYFGMHMNDFHKTNPSALLTMIINNLKKFNVDTTFLSSIQAQISKGRVKRSPEEPDAPDATTATPTTARDPETTEKASTHNTSIPFTLDMPTPSKLRRRGTEGPSTSGSSVAMITTPRASRLRRSTAEPNQSKSAWRSIAEISSKIFLPLPLDTKKTVLLPVPFIEKNLTLRYRHSVDMLGLPGYQFVLGNAIGSGGDSSSRSELYPSLSYSRVKDGERTESPSNTHLPRHRNNDRRKHLHRHSKHQNFLDNDMFRNSYNEVLGVVDLEPLLLETIGRLLLIGRYVERYPFWLSAPHFLSLTDHIGSANGTASDKGTKVKVLPQTSSQLSPTNSNLLLGVNGISANESLHGSFIYYHPILGVPINASLAVQLGIRPPEGMLHAHKLVPVMWARIQVEEIPLSLWYILWAACHLRETIMACFIITGLLVISCSLTCGKKKRGEDEEKPLEERPNSA
ncbi:uncharacterized protein [Penaeus vannamei]|uniref:uncharacterized protein n=1 Tax=Penaeus vannamei TaxID=6689 RepID=UPI00387F7C7E